MISELKPQYQRGCYTYSQTKEWFVSLSKPVVNDARSNGNSSTHLSVRIYPTYRVISIPVESGDYRLADLPVYWQPSGTVDMCAESRPTRGAESLSKVKLRGRVIVEFPDGADLCHP